MADHFQPARAKDLRAELGFDKKDKNFKAKKTTLRKIVANMSLNSAEMIGLFPDVANCLRIDDLEVKRLASLYVETYAKARVDMATRALPFLVQDTKHNNPLIRSLALRTVSAIPIQAFIDETLKICKVLAKDDDPLVRVAAVYAMAKVWSHEPEAAENAGFSTTLNRMLNDKHPRVSATAVSCLLEVASLTPAMTITINHSTASHLVKILGSCNEWCQIYILRILQYFVPMTHSDAAEVLVHAFPRIQHANTAVVLAAIRLTIYLLNFIDDYKAVVPNFDKIFQTPFALLMSKPPQLQYIMLRNLIILLQSHPRLIHLDAHIFFSTYNDPTYVRTSKLEVLYSLANESNARDIISEFYTCAADVDIEASRKAINILGRLSLKLPNFADDCVYRLRDVCNSGAPYIIQEVTIALHYILRRFPDRYARDFIPVLCDCRNDIFDDEDAKVALLWILGEHPRDTVDLPDILVELISCYADEPLRVQMALLTTSVKLFIAHPQSTRDIIPKVFETATQEADDPDLRDRAFMYWRLLSHDPQRAQSIVLSDSTEIDNNVNKLSDSVLEELDHSLGYLSSLYLKPPSRMFRAVKQYELPQSPVLVPRKKYRDSSPSDHMPTQSSANQNTPRPPPTRQLSQMSLDNGNSTQFPHQIFTRVNTGLSTGTNNMTPVPESPPGVSPFNDQNDKLIDI